MSDNNNSKKKKEVLIVDDIPDNIELLSNILYFEGFTIRFANDGQQAIDSVHENPPTLILLDISMPVLNGYEVCEILKADETTKDIPIIFLTALTETEDIVRGFRVGGQDFVTKPFNAEELLARIRTHMELKEKKEEIQQYANRLSILNEQLNEQKLTIERKNKDLTDSIDYAKIIQNSFLPSYDKLRKMFINSFIIYRPKDIVSGDFFCFEQVGSWQIIVVADCTGHGVPGALLSMLGTSLLNQIIVNQKITSPAEILRKLNEEFTQTLSNETPNELSTDGIDIGICAFDLRSDRLIFSGCKRPLYLIRNAEVQKFKGGIQSIGGYNLHREKFFHDTEITLEHGDNIYLFSDGYNDQFGSSNNKKFGTRRFTNLLKSLSTKSMYQQKTQLVSELINWQGNESQIDDILIVGIQYIQKSTL